MENLKIYADTNIYSRPLDDISKSKIKLESEACLALLHLASQGKVTLYSSDILKFEVIRAPLEKRVHLSTPLALCKKHIEETLEIKTAAQALVKRYHVQPRDALHVASASKHFLDFFITCDYDVTHKLRNYKRIKVINPVNFIQIYANRN